MKAIISDIHGNLEALRAVLEEIDSLGVKDVVCLGDVVGYGPEPRECLDIIQNITSLNVLGNHEEACLYGIPPNFTPRARRALQWTRKELFESKEEESVKEARRKFVESFKVQARVDGVTYVHGSPRGPTRDYVMPRDANDKRKMNEIFSVLEDYCFCGHTHTPGIFTSEGFAHPSDLFELYMLGSDEKVLINVGSVGQPRDGDNRACFITFDGDTVVWRRVEYDFEKTSDQIYAIPELDDFLGDRLKEGR